MPALNELLERLRRMRPPPGTAAAAIAVPSPGEQRSGEVEFLFARLDAVEGDAERILAAARAAAEQIEVRAHERCRLLLDDARAGAAAHAAELEAQRAADCERRARALIAAGEREAERVRARGRERIPGFARALAGRILEQAP